MTLRQIVDEETMTAGVKRQRVLSLVDRLHRDGAINFAQWSAADILRNAVMAEMPPSSGVSSYGANIKAMEPHAKADRLGCRLTGFVVTLQGRVMLVGRGKSRQGERDLEDALFAAVGVNDDDGRRHLNIKHAGMLVRICVQTESMPTLSEITQQLTDYYGTKSKQTPPFALGVVSTWLGRLALHYRLAK